MTIIMALRIMLRRWYVVLAVFAMAGTCLYWQVKHAGVYASYAVVTLLPSNGRFVATDPYGDPTPYTTFASALVQQFNEGRTQEPLSTTTAPLYGVGVRQGIQVSLANSGNQWVNQFDQPSIIVQVVGPTKAWVDANTRSVVGDLISLSDRMQAQSGIVPAQRMVAQQQPLTGLAAHVAPGRKTELIAVGAFGAAALIVASALAVWTDALASALMQRRARRGRELAVVAGARPALKGI
ncbi:hypothetical protein [Gryllotalpicola koreensis]|uniref:Polysaccharide chain length determinant N-terminal domain-containing protein n=1 Tax=Gryllotalpicola koreensis TaxID=993086 RepID=A0ABP7ZPF1_9MICO